MSDALDATLRTLVAIAFDVDGTLSDGRITWSPSGEEFKSFYFPDIMGISLLRRLGLKLALISGEATPQVDLFAKKMHIPFVAKGTREKATALREFTQKHGVALAQICFFGDDINDLPAMELAGLCACPANASGEVLTAVRERQGFVSSRAGGDGAVRELVDALLKARGLRGQDVFLTPPPV